MTAKIKPTPKTTKPARKPASTTKYAKILGKLGGRPRGS